MATLRKKLFVSYYLFWTLLICVVTSLYATQKYVGEIQSVQLVDQIGIKQREMLDPVVRIRTRQHTGSGTIYEKLETETEGVFEYRVLTNEHITRTRMIFSQNADFLIGKLITISVDTGCSIVVFDQENQTNRRHVGKVVAEDHYLDLAILSFETDQIISVATIATKKMLRDIRVFDEVFAVGCQLGMIPIPTFGIISRITSGDAHDIEWILYGTTSPISRGSSGGGLFRKYDEHYYLIGIPFRVATTRSKQAIPHLANAISVFTAIKLIDNNSVGGE